MSGREVDVSLFSYAGDLRKKLLVSTAEVARQKIAVCDMELGTALASRGMAQNRDKKEIMSTCCGKESVRHTYSCYNVGMPGHGTFRRVARYLGPHMHYSGASSAERSQRWRACKIGFALLGQFWGSDTPLRFKTGVFKANVYNAALSGFEAWVMGKGGLDALDRTLVWLARNSPGVRHARGPEMAKRPGTATSRTRRYEGGCSVLLSGWSSECEDCDGTRQWLLSQRTAQPCLQCCSGTCGPLGASLRSIVNPDGTLGEHANPWLCQMLEDIETLKVHDDLARIPELLEGRPLRLFQDGEIREAFLACDVSILRSACHRAAIPPLGHPAHAAPGGRADLREGGDFVCEERLSGGAVCGGRFRSHRALPCGT